MLTGIKVPPAVERLQKDRLKNMTMASEVSEQTNNILKKGLSLEIQKRYFSVLNLSCDIKSNMESKEEITKQYMKDTGSFGERSGFRLQQILMKEIFLRKRNGYQGEK